MILNNSFYKFQKFILCPSVHYCLILYLHTHYFSYIVSFGCHVESHHWRTGSSQLFQCCSLRSEGATKMCWSLPVSSAVRPASPCSVPSPPAAHSGDWRCPAWSPSARLRTNRYGSRQKGKNMRLISVPVYTISHLVLPSLPHLQWSRRSLCPLGLWLCSALWVASWSSASGNSKQKAEFQLKLATLRKKQHIDTWYLVGLLEVPYEHRPLSTPSCKVKMKIQIQKQITFPNMLGFKKKGETVDLQQNH